MGRAPAPARSCEIQLRRGHFAVNILRSEQHWIHNALGLLIESCQYISCTCPIRLERLQSLVASLVVLVGCGRKQCVFG